jgi:hypothetical protein
MVVGRIGCDGCWSTLTFCARGRYRRKQPDALALLPPAHLTP